MLLNNLNMLLDFDSRVFFLINSGCTYDIFELVMPVITHMGDSVVVWLWIFVLGCSRIWQLSRSDAAGTVNTHKGSQIIKAGLLFCLYLALIYGVNAGIYVGLKHAVGRPRPFIQQSATLRVSEDVASDLSKDGSFPSGHACNAVMIALFFSDRFRKKACIFYFLAGLVALSRIYLGVHYPGDVIAGGVLGWCITWLMLSFKKLRNNIARENLLEQQ